MTFNESRPCKHTVSLGPLDNSKWKEGVLISVLTGVELGMVVNHLPHRDSFERFCKQSRPRSGLPDQGLLCLLLKYDISDPTELNLTNNFFVLCTDMKVYLYNYS